MKKVLLVLVCLLLNVMTNAQNVKLINGLYLNENQEAFSGILITRNEAGQKNAELSILNGKLHGEANYYYASGSRMESGFFENGLKAGLWIRFNENGKKIGSGSFLDGKKTGNWLVWDDKGVLRFEMQYIEGQKVGTWNSFDENGVLLSSNNYGQVN